MSMRSTITLAILQIIGAGATPILDVRQVALLRNGSMSLYSEPSCHASNILAKNITVATGCTILDTPVESVMLHRGSTFAGFEGIHWYRELYIHVLNSNKANPHTNSVNTYNKLNCESRSQNGYSNEQES